MRVVHLIKSVRSDEVVMGVFESQLDKMPSFRIYCLKVVDRILRNPVVIEAIILASVIIGMVDTGNPGPLF